MLLSEEPGLEWAGESAGGEDALERIEELRPDVVLMDFRLEGMDGLQMAATITAKHPEINVLIITGYGNEIYLAEALQNKVSGFITKDSSKDLISNAIKTVANKGTVWDPELLYSAVVGLGYLKRGGTTSRDAGHLEAAMVKSGINSEQFAPKELETMAFLSKGLSNKEIAIKLGVSVASVKKYVSDIMSKLGAANRTTAAVVAAHFLEKAIDPGENVQSSSV
ncbi:DNA-binding response regulator LuxR family [Dehalogenimonas sp. WBC-2]|nr:DNA-binding response regulator LuxR family [Dehalogenimonas sp. WBC-2]